MNELVKNWIIKAENDFKIGVPCLNEEKTTGICIEKAEKVFYFKIKNYQNARQ